MPWVDLALLAVLAAFALGGLVQGLVRQLAGWLGLILGLILAVLFAPWLARRIAPPQPPFYLTLVVFALIVVGVWTVASILGRLHQQRAAQQARDGWDEIGGALLGLASGVLVLLVALPMLIRLGVISAEPLATSVLGAWLLRLAEQLWPSAR
jgi:membrane protein required for colicin V production